MAGAGGMPGAGWLVSEGNFRRCPPRGAGCLLKGAVVWGVKHVRSRSSPGPSHFEDSYLCFEAAVDDIRLCPQRGGRWGTREVEMDGVSLCFRPGLTLERR